MRLQGRPDRSWLVALAGVVLVVLLVAAAYFIFLKPA